MFMYEGVDCLLDSNTDLFANLTAISQEGKNAWAYQGTYAFYVSYFAAVLIFLLIVKKVLYKYTDYKSRNGGISGKRFNFPIFNKLTALGRAISYSRLSVIVSRITGLPASFGTLLLYAASTIFIFAWAFAPRPYLRGCAGFGAPPIAVRTGMMVMAMTPFLYILSGKTNFISGVTGISYEKVNIFHQYLGWASLAFSWIHTIPFLYQANREGGASAMRDTWNTNYLWRNGVPPLIFITLLCFGFTRFPRKYLYEAFWHIHWILAIGYYIGLTIHVYGSMGAEKYMWGTLAFWGFQILYRLLVKSTFKPNSYSFKRKRATLKAVSGNSFEVIVPIKSPVELDWAPGQHVFVRFVHGIRTIDNHPFSIITVPSVDQKNYNLKLLVKPKKGFTRTLYEEILKEKDAKEYDLFIDGPYGGMNRDSLAFDKLFLVATGTGITVTFPFLQYASQHILNPSSLLRNIELHWVISSISQLKDIENELRETYRVLEAVSPKFLDNVTFNIYVTNSEPESKYTPIEEKPPIIEKHYLELDTSTDDEFDYTKYLTIHHNIKPNFSEVFQSVTLDKKNAFVISGSVSAQADVGNAVAKLQSKVLKGDVEEIYLHTESFSW